MMPKHVREEHPASVIKQWFDLADADGSGSISVNEFFLWTLGTSAIKYGVNSLKAAFEKYDRDKTGQLDLREFSRAADEMGFGLYANEIFAELDHDGGGSISYYEVAEALASKVPKDPKTK